MIDAFSYSHRVYNLLFLWEYHRKITVMSHTETTGDPYHEYIFHKFR